MAFEGHNINTQVGGVVCDREKIEGAVNLDLGIKVGMVNGDSLCKTVCRVGVYTLVGCGVGIGRQVGMQMQVTPEQLGLGTYLDRRSTDQSSKYQACYMILVFDGHLYPLLFFG